MANEEFILNLVVCKHNIQEFRCRKSVKLEYTAIEVATLILRQELGKAQNNDYRSVACQQHFQTFPVRHTKIAMKFTVHLTSEIEIDKCRTLNFKLFEIYDRS